MKSIFASFPGLTTRLLERVTRPFQLFLIALQLGKTQRRSPELHIDAAGRNRIRRQGLPLVRRSQCIARAGL